MPYCQNCGEKISDHQFQNYNKFCPASIKIRQLSKLENNDIFTNQICFDLDYFFEDKSVVYVLKLQNGKWWIGETKNLKSRIKKYKEGKDNEWIAEHPLISIESVELDGDLTESTLVYMKKYGMDNVRSTCYTENTPEIYIPRKILNYVSRASILKTEEHNIENLNKKTRQSEENQIVQQNFPENSQNKKKVYSLKLENKKWYILETKDLSKEVKKIKSGKGPSWTKLYRLIKVEKEFKNKNLRTVTLEYMKKYGWWNVRGYTIKGENWPPEEIKEQFEDYEEGIGEEKIYILRLENDKWFIDKTRNLSYSMDLHRNGSPPWVDIHKPLELYEVIEEGDAKVITLDYMKKYGWENVRGFPWKAWNLKNPPKELRKNE